MKACLLLFQGEYSIYFLSLLSSNIYIFIKVHTEQPKLELFQTFGTEFKVDTDGMTGCMVSIEVQEGKIVMRDKQFNRELSTVADLL